MLAQHGPRNPVHGFPNTYTDFNGVTLELCLDTADPLCGAVGDALPNPDLPLSFPDNFPDESFWWSADATLPIAGGGEAQLVLAQEAAFGGPLGEVVDGDQVAFGRIRIRVTGLIPGELYTVTHPYGVEQFVATTDVRNINFTEDSIGLPGDFRTTLAGRIGPFLVWSPLDEAPEGYVGDPDVPHQVTGSPLGTNFFRIEGPGVGTAGSPDLCDGESLDCIQTDLFQVMGRIGIAEDPGPDPDPNLPPYNPGLVAVGPVSPENGYPISYTDSNGFTLGLCLEPDPICGEILDEMPDPASPIVFPDNFPGEAFWWSAEATMNGGGNVEALLVLALEAAFGGADEAVRDGDQVSFGRVRVRVEGLVQGQTYRVTHPYGVLEFVATGETRNINYTADVGGLPGDFDYARRGEIGPFLTWSPLTDAPAGYVGDPAIPHAVTGSPLGTNFFRLEGPNVGAPDAANLCNPPATDCIQTDLFSVVGKLATLAPVTDFAAVPGDSTVSLSWTNSVSPTATGTLILRSTTGFATSPEPTADQVQVFDGPESLFVDTGLVNGTTYFYTAFAHDAVGLFSPPVTVSAVPNVPPLAPVTDLSAVAGDASVALSWVNSTDPAATGTLILRSTTGFATSPVPSADQTQIFDGPVSLFIDLGLANGTTYFYTAFAHDGAGRFSDPVTVSATPADPSVIAPVTNLAATAGDATVALTWTPSVSPSATSTLVLRSTTGFATLPESSVDQVQVFDGPGGVFVDTGLVNGTTYFYTAFAHDAGGAISTAATVSAQPVAPPLALAPVTDFTAVAGSGSVALSWTPSVSAAAAGTLIVRSTTGFASDLASLVDQVPVFVGAGSSFTDTGLTNGTTYFYTAFVFDNAANFSAPSTVSAVPFAPPPLLPVTNLAAVPGAGSIVLSWTPSASATATGTLILRSTTGFATSPASSGDQLPVYLGAGALFVDTGLTNGTTYFYTAYAFDNASGLSTAATVSAAPGALPALAPVTNLATVPGDAQVSLSWTASTDPAATGTILLRSTVGFASAPQASATQQVVFDGAGTSFVDTWLVNGTLYFYTAFAVDPTRVSSATTTIAQPTAPVTPPLAPLTGFAAVAGNAQVSLTWTPSTDVAATGTVVMRSPTGFASTPVPGADQQVVFSGAGTSFVDTGLVNGTTYFYTAFAVDPLRVSTAATASAQPVAPVAPGPMVSLFADAFDCDDAIGLSASWTTNGTWYCRSGRARGETSGGTALLTAWVLGDTEVSARVRLGSANNSGLIARSASGRYYAARLGATGVLQVVRVDGAQVTVLGSASVGTPTGTTAMSLRVTGTNPVRLMASFAGSTAVDVLDTSAGQLAAGAAGLLSGSNARTQYDDFTLAGSEVTGVPPPPPPPPAAFTFADNFNACDSDTNLGPRWTTVGRWYCRSDRARGESSRSVATANTDPGENMSVEATVRLTGSASGSGVVARVSGSSWYAARLMSNQRVQVVRGEGALETVLADVPVAFNVDASNRLRLEVSGSADVQLDVTLNGAPVVGASDSSPARLLSGRAGLLSGSTDRTQFDDFSAVAE